MQVINSSGLIFAPEIKTYRDAFEWYVLTGIMSSDYDWQYEDAGYLLPGVGYMVPTDLSSSIIAGIISRSVMLPEVQLRRFSKNAARVTKPSIEVDDRGEGHLGQISIESKPHTVTARLGSLLTRWYDIQLQAVQLFSELIDVAIVTGHPESTAIQGIYQSPVTSGERSTGMSSVGGYVEIDVNATNSDPYKECLFHLPRGYRAKSKWILSNLTQTHLVTGQDSNGNFIIDWRENRDIKDVTHMLGRPIIKDERLYNMMDTQPTEFVGLFGDLTRGYIAGMSDTLYLKMSEDGSKCHLTLYACGQVVQPAAFKLLKHVGLPLG